MSAATVERPTERAGARPVLWRPHEGPQRRFLASTAYEALYGGAAGGGKSDALLYGGLRQVGHPAYRALLVRRTYPELRELMDRSLGTFRQLGAAWNESGRRWAFPSGATFEFGYAETYKDVLRYQGHEFTYIGWDELGLCPEERMWLFLLSRNRASAPGLILQARGSANPGGPGHAWLKKRFVLPCGIDGATVYADPATGLTRAYVPARLTDNPTLLRNDPLYVKRLEAQPERTRRQLLDGDWDAGDGLALEELTRAQHLVPVHEVPDRWFQWGAFDWGFRHPFSFGHFAADEDGTVVLVNAVHGRGLLPAQIAERVRETIPVERLRLVVAGHDCWADHKARGERVPTIAEAFASAGIRLSRANISRKAGLNNLRRYVAWRGTGAEIAPGKRADGAPAFRILKTRAGTRVFDALERMVSDPDDVEDVLKVDADPDTGEGGDDEYDMVRYGLAARPLKGKPAPEAPISAWDGVVLAAEAERRKVNVTPPGRKVPVDSDWGEW